MLVERMEELGLKLIEAIQQGVEVIPPLISQTIQEIVVYELYQSIIILGFLLFVNLVGVVVNIWIFKCTERDKHGCLYEGSFFISLSIWLCIFVASCCMVWQALDITQCLTAPNLVIIENLKFMLHR